MDEKDGSSPASEGEAGSCNKTAAKVRAFYADNSVAKSKKDG